MNGLEHNFELGEQCLAPWKSQGTFPAVIVAMDGRKKALQLLFMVFIYMFNSDLNEHQETKYFLTVFRL